MSTNTPITDRQLGAAMTDLAQYGVVYLPSEAAAKYVQEQYVKKTTIDRVCKTSTWSVREDN